MEEQESKQEGEIMSWKEIKIKDIPGANELWQN